MNRVELENIEKRLNIRLPANYRKLVAPLPVAGHRGGSKGWLWDDIEKIVEYNSYLREEHEWPEYYFCVGEDGSGGQFLIDLRKSDPPVLRTEFENISTMKKVAFKDAPSPLSLDKWYAIYIQRLIRVDTDITDRAEPEEPRPIEPTESEPKEITPKEIEPKEITPTEKPAERRPTEIEPMEAERSKGSLGLFFYHIVFYIFMAAFVALLGTGLVALVFTLMQKMVNLRPALTIIGGALIVTGPLIMLLGRKRKR